MYRVGFGHTGIVPITHKASKSHQNVQKWYYDIMSILASRYFVETNQHRGIFIFTRIRQYYEKKKIEFQK